jgi:hypothetical protein
MKKLLLLITTIFITTFGFSQNPCETIFISEYVEGWSNNKALELYNPTNEPVDLSDYRIDRYSNGNSSAGVKYKIPLAGIMPPLSVYVIVLDQRDTNGTGQTAPVWEELQAKADTFLCPVYDINRVMYFNGNDAMVLVNDADGGAGFIWDVIGVIGEDPGSPSEIDGGWNNVAPDYTVIANGSDAWTEDNSLIRKSDVVFGVFTPPGAGEWDVSVQWDSIPAVLYNDDGIVTGGNWSSLGNHTCDCGDVIDGISAVNPAVKFDIFPNPVSNEMKINSEVAVADIDIYNINGKLIYSISGLMKKEVVLNSSEWEKGMYLVNLRFENNIVISKRIVKQ